jgi:aryl-alcohol dehydrogenase-like predicted oxidoreductase
MQSMDYVKLGRTGLDVSRICLCRCRHGRRPVRRAAAQVALASLLRNL